MVSQQVTSEAEAACAETAERGGPKGTAKPSAKPPPAALAPTRKERRLKPPPDVMKNPLIHPRNNARFPTDINPWCDATDNNLGSSATKITLRGIAHGDRYAER